MKSFFAIAMLFVVPYSVSYAQERSMDGGVPITGGTFLMGTDRAEIAGLKSRYQIDFPGIFENESPAHRIRDDKDAESLVSCRKTTKS